jgi:hypothetical protein
MTIGTCGSRSDQGQAGHRKAPDLPGCLSRQVQRWYPDVVAAGDTRQAWQTEFDRLGLSFRVGLREGANPHRTASVENADRRADLLMSPWKRQFYLALRSDRYTLLQGFAADLATAADAATLWLSGIRPGQVAATAPAAAVHQPLDPAFQQDAAVAVYPGSSCG